MNKTKKMILISIFVALSLVLDYIKSFIPFLNMPSGGSINIALIPICVCSFYLGIKDGIISGFFWWSISSLIGLNSWFLNVPQYLVDYVLPSIIPGISSIFYKKNNIVSIEFGILVSMILRTICLLVSGAIFWPDGVAANSNAAWIGSAVYNLPYSIATTIMLMIVIPIILKAIKSK